jgi:cell division septation protein DedD
MDLARRLLRAAAALVLVLAPARAGAQTDARVVAALRLAQEGRIDSARTMLAAMEKSVAPTDTAFAQVLYAEGLVAPTVSDARQRLQRVVTEYPLSPWADDAVLRLAQLEYADGDPAAAARQLERFHNEYAASPLFPTAAMWAGRSLLRAKDTLGGCRWVSEGLGRAGQDAATRRDLAALQAKCGGKAAVRDVAAAPPARTDSSIVPTPVPTPAAAPATPAAPSTSAWRVQIVAAGTAAEADAEASRAKRAGFDAIVVREGPYHKVRLGSYASRADATAAAARVKAALGGQPFVVQDK